MIKSNLLKLALLGSVVLSASASASAFAAGGEAATGIKADAAVPGLSVKSNTKTDLGVKAEGTTKGATDAAHSTAKNTHHKASKAKSKAKADVKAGADVKAQDSTTAETPAK